MPDPPISTSQDAQDLYEKGRSYRKGINGFEQSDSKAVSYWQEAAKLGHSEAQFSLAYMYHKGHGVEVDYKQALSWYSMAANQNNPKALANIGNMYQEGLGTPVNEKLAREAFQKGSDLGNATARCNLAFHILNNESGSEAQDQAFIMIRSSVELGLEAPKTDDVDIHLVFAIANQNLSCAKLFSEKNLKREPSHRKPYVSYVHWIAHEGLLGLLPPGVLCEELLTLKNYQGKSPLHVAAKIKNLKQVPQSLLNEENLSSRDRSNCKVIDIAYQSGIIHQIPSAFRYLSEDYVHDQLTQAIDCGDLSDDILFSPPNLRLCPRGSADTGCYLHLIAIRGLLSKLSSQSFHKSLFEKGDREGKTPLHLAAERGELGVIPEEYRADHGLLIMTDHYGTSCFHHAAATPELGGIPIHMFNADVLLMSRSAGESVADIIDTAGNTLLLPKEMQYYSRRKGLAVIKNLFDRDFIQAKVEHSNKWRNVVSREEFRSLRNEFVRDWVASHIIAADGQSLLLDKEQAEAVAESGTHIHVTARAGSGKTRSLVTRVIFMIRHCQITAGSILILAFNKKAVNELHSRLQEQLGDEQMPHVMTFHALGKRIEKPTEDLLYDDDDQRLSQKIQKIIADELTSGDLEYRIRALMERNWTKSLTQIINEGLDLPPEQLEQFREHMQDRTIDLRWVNNSTDKTIGNFLFRRNLKYSYHRTLKRDGTDSYTPPFVAYTANNEKIIIELEDSSNNSAKDAFLRSDYSAEFKRISLGNDQITSRESLIHALEKEFDALNIKLTPLSRDELWEKLRETRINDFTKTILQFINRAQKELLWPDELEEKIDQRLDSASDLQLEFWLISLEIFRIYHQSLLKNNETDFDHIMLNAANSIQRGKTKFSSESGMGDLTKLGHILIDEYQDFSHLFEKLRKAIISKNKSALFFCVGDDWQAINKFAGSDLSYFSKFSSEFKPCSALSIATNYRSCPEVVKAGNIVMQEHGTPSKAKADTASGLVTIARSCEGDALTSAEEIIEKKFGILGVDILRLAQAAIRKYDSPANDPDDKNHRSPLVAVLSRKSHLSTPDEYLSLEKWQTRLQRHLPENQRKYIVFSTTHGFKGKEAKVIILLSPESYPTIHPNSIFNTIFGDTFDADIEDERRLFYVGVTRAEQRLYLLKESDDNIEFLNDQAHRQTLLKGMTSNLLLGDEIHVTLKDSERHLDRKSQGTKPLSQILKSDKVGFKYSGTTFQWSKHVPAEYLPTPQSCRDFLLQSPWIKNADKIATSFVSDQGTVDFIIEDGLPSRINADLSDEQTDDVEYLNQMGEANIGAIIQELYTKHDAPWPCISYEGLDTRGLSKGILEVAWPDFRVGISFPDNDGSFFEQNGWSLHDSATVNLETLRGQLLVYPS